MLNNKRCW